MKTQKRETFRYDYAREVWSDSNNMAVGGYVTDVYAHVSDKYAHSQYDEFAIELSEYRAVEGDLTRDVIVARIRY